MYPLKYLDMEITMVNPKIFSIYGRMFGFALGTSDGIKVGIIEKTDLGSLKNIYIWQSWWFT